MAAVQAIHALAQASHSDEDAKGALCCVCSSSRFASKQPTEVDEAIAAGVDALVAMRLELLKAKNFAKPTRIRDELAAKGIQLKDGKDKDNGERVTTWERKRYRKREASMGEVIPVAASAARSAFASPAP